MNREAFIEKILTLYSNAFTEKNKQAWWDDYKRVLPEFGVDYDKLDEFRVRNYDKSMPPKPAFFIQYIPMCRTSNIDDLDDTKTITVIFPWAGSYPYEFVVQKHQTEKDVLRRYMPKNWHWNFTLNKPEPNEV